MIEESFSVGGSEIYDQEVESSIQIQQKQHAARGNHRRGDHYNQDEDEDMAIDSSGK